MLVLTRKTGESVCVGSALEVRVLSVCGGRVKLGFSGPPEIIVQRSEIRDVARVARIPADRQPSRGAVDVEPFDIAVV